MTSPRVIASYKVTFGAAVIAASINAVFACCGMGVGQVQFSRQEGVDALVDLPFALPTAVAGITLATVNSANG